MKSNEIRKQAAIAYELFRRYHKGLRPDGATIPAFEALPLAIQFGVESVVTAALYYQTPAKSKEK